MDGVEGHDSNASRRWIYIGFAVFYLRVRSRCCLTNHNH